MSNLDLTIKDTENSSDDAQQERLDNEFDPTPPRHISVILPICLAHLMPKGGEHE